MKPESQTKLASRLNSVRQAPSDRVWASIESKMDAKKKKKAIWFPYLAAAMLVALVGVSGVFFMEQESVKPFEPEFLIPNEIPQSPTQEDASGLIEEESKPEIEAEDLVDQSSRESATQDLPLEKQTESKPKVLLAGVSSKQETPANSVDRDQLDPINNPIGGLNSAPSENNLAQVVVKKGKKNRPEEPGKKPSTAERILNVKPTQAVAQIKNLKDPENWKLSEVDLRLPKIFRDGNKTEE